MSTAENFVRPMGFWELFGVGFKIFLRHFWLFVALTGVPAIFSFVGAGLGQSTDATQTQKLIGLIIQLLGIVLSFFSVAITLLVASYITIGQTINLKYIAKQALSGALFRKLVSVSLVIALPTGIVTIIYVVLMFGLLTGSSSISNSTAQLLLIAIFCGLILAFPLLIIFLTSATFFTSCVAVLEKRSVGDTIRRAWSLTLFNYWRIVFSLIVFFILILIMQFSVLPLLLAKSGLLIILFTLVYLLVLASISSFQNLTIVLLYYEIRARKENYNKTLLAQEMGYASITEMI